MITVYHWDLEYPGSTIGWRVGHASIRVDGGAPAGDVYMSWFPTKHLALSSTARRNETFQQDVASEESPPTGVLVVGTPQKTLDETAIKAWWVRFLQHPPAWSLFSTNCSQLVIDAMRVGGSDKYLGGDTLGFIPPYQSWSTVWRPSQIEDYVRAVNAGLSKPER